MAAAAAENDNPQRMKSDNTLMHVKAQATRAGFKRPAFWVLAFGWSLALCAGFVNVVAMLSWKTYVSHVTGGTTSIGLRAQGYHSGEMPLDPLGRSIATLTSFLLGAFLCGLIIDKNQVHLGGKSFYGLALIGNSALLLTSVFVSSDVLAGCLAAAACGLQNAMCTSHFGAVVRTTHVTGTLTDIGSTSGRIAMIFMRKGCMRSRLNVLERAEVGVDARKLLVLGPMWVFFLLGTITGAFVGSALQKPAQALFLPAGFTLATGTLYTFFRQRFKDYFKALAQEQLRHDVEDVEASVSRAKSYLKDVRKNTGNVQHMQTAVLDNLESEMDQIMDTMHQVEVEIEDMQSEQASQASPSAKSVRTKKSDEQETVCVV